MNSINIIGNITREIETRIVGDNFTIANFTIAYNKNVKVNGEWQKKGCFFDCKAIGKTAENISKYFKKGSKIALSGSLDMDSWEKDGQKRSRIYIEVESFDFCESNTQNTYTKKDNIHESVLPDDPWGSADDPWGSADDDKNIPF